MYVKGTMLDAVEEIQSQSGMVLPLREADGLYVLTQLWE